MNFHQLRVFREVARRRSFTAGAEALMLSQPAASLHVRALERELGVRLLERTPRGLVLTEAGEAALTASETILSTLAQMEQTVAEMRGARRGRVVVGANTTGGMYVAPGIIAAYRTAHPEVELELQIDGTERLYESIVQGRLDLAIVGGPADSTRFDVRPLCRDELVLIARSDHPLAARSTLRLADVARESVIVAEPGSRMRALVESVFRDAGLALRPRLALSGTEALKKAVESGLGVAFVSAYAVTREVADGTLRILRVAEVRFAREYEVVSLKGRYLTPAIGGFVEFARAYADRHLRTPPLVEAASRARRRARA